PDRAGGVAVSITYLDGFLRPLQRKTLVEPGAAITRDTQGRVELDNNGTPVLSDATERWLTGGHLVYNAKQEVVRTYEPYFSPRSAFESDAELQSYGVATIHSYDALGRPVEVRHPNGSNSTTRYSAWSIEHRDPNDNVIGSDWASTRSTLPTTDPERRA